jgi:hypothetical protein
MAIKRTPGTPSSDRLRGSTDELRAAAARAQQVEDEARAEEIATEQGTVPITGREPTLDGSVRDEGALLAEAAAQAGLDVSGEGDETPPGPSAVPGATDFIDRVTGGGLPTSKLDAIDGSGGPDDVDLFDEMDTSVADLTGGTSRRDALRQAVADGSTAEDSDRMTSIKEQGTGAISDGGLTTPGLRYEEGEGVKWSGKGRTAEGQGEQIEMMSGLIGANLRLGQEMIDEADGKGAGAPSAEAPPSTITEIRNGNTHTTHPDGTKTTYFPDEGTEVIRSKDGTVEIRRDDNTRTVKKPDGTIIDYDAKGNATTTPPPSTPNEERPVRIDLITEGALADQFAQLKGGGSGDVDPVDDGAELDFTDFEPRYTKDKLLGGDRADDSVDGTRSGVDMGPDFNGNAGVIDPGPDGTGPGGTGPDQDRLAGTRLDEDAAPNVGLPGVGVSSGGVVDAPDLGPGLVLEPVTSEVADAAAEAEAAFAPDEPVVLDEPPEPIPTFRPIAPERVDFDAFDPD